MGLVTQETVASASYSGNRVSEEGRASAWHSLTGARERVDEWGSGRAGENE